MTAQEFFDRFEYDPKTDLLGEGGFGEVYLATNKKRSRC